MMRNFCYCLLIAIIPSVSVFAATDQQTVKNKMLSELDVIKSIFEVKYAPAEWKKSFANWDLDEQINIAKAKVQSSNSITVKEFQTVIKQFLNSTRDYHVGVFFYSTEASFLPFRAQCANGKYFITWLDASAAPSSWNVGDEIVLFNGKPTDVAIQDIKAHELGNPESLTDQGLAEMFLTSRIGAVGHRVPSGKIEIVIQKKSGETVTETLQWDHSAEEVSDGPFRAQAFSMKPMKFQNTKALDRSNLFKREMTAGFYKTLAENIQRSYSSNDINGAKLLGNRSGFLPPLGQIIWESNPKDFYHAYLFKTPSQKTVGYIRIPHFTGDNEEAKEFARVIKMFESKSDALVIDENNNPGGNVMLMYAMASMLSKKPLEVPMQKITLTQEEIYFAIMTLEDLKDVTNPDVLKKLEMEEETISGYQITPEVIQGIVNFFQFTVDEWNAGRCITNLHYLYGIDKLKPSTKACYTKPILVLANHLSVSCGDFFPAILQDNKRATILGTQTAGAGGFVLMHGFPSHFGLAYFSYTGSIAERPNKSPLENLGVTPDIKYMISEKDLKQNYVEYTDLIHKTLEDIIKKAPRR